MILKRGNPSHHTTVHRMSSQAMYKNPCSGEFPWAKSSIAKVSFQKFSMHSDGHLGLQQKLQHLCWPNATLAALHQTQSCEQVSPLPASLMSHDPEDTVNKPGDAKGPLHLPQEVNALPVTAYPVQGCHCAALSFPRLQSNPWQGVTLCVSHTHMDGGTQPHMDPQRYTCVHLKLPSFIASLCCEYAALQPGQLLLR